jgi:CRP-like cAMP-binding protein
MNHGGCFIFHSSFAHYHTLQYQIPGSTMKASSPVNQPVLASLENTPAITNKRRLTLSAGEDAFDMERTREYFYFILEGKIKVSQVNPDTGKEQTLYLLTRGDMFDVVTLMDDQPHEFLSEVLEEAEVVEVPIESVRKLMREDEAFQEFFFPYVAGKLRGMEELAADLSLYDVYQRVIRLFSRFVDNHSGEPKLKVIDTLSHEELASMIGSVRKVINRSLQTLKDEGVVELSRKHIQLKSLKRLLEKL